MMQKSTNENDDDRRLKIPQTSLKGGGRVLFYRRVSFWPDENFFISFVVRSGVVEEEEIKPKMKGEKYRRQKPKKERTKKGTTKKSKKRCATKKKETGWGKEK